MNKNQFKKFIALYKEQREKLDTLYNVGLDPDKLIENYEEIINGFLDLLFNPEQVHLIDQHQWGDNKNNLDKAWKKIEELKY